MPEQSNVRGSARQIETPVDVVRTSLRSGTAQRYEIRLPNMRQALARAQNENDVPFIARGHRSAMGTIRRIMDETFNRAQGDLWHRLSPPQGFRRSLVAMRDDTGRAASALRGVYSIIAVNDPSVPDIIIGSTSSASANFARFRRRFAAQSDAFVDLISEEMTSTFNKSYNSVAGA